ncbi:MAG: hypothetical protein FD121_1521 [Gallionellaceae bacterium]|nr:MAG: hypothetical protein FD121_1521 [Gallionellaceae bacterium]
MASISDTAANLYNYTAPVTDTSLLNDKKANSNVSPSTVAQAKLAVESTIVSIGNNQKEDPLTYNALGLLGNTNQNNITQNPVLQVQSVITDTLNSLRSDATANIPNDILAQLNIPGVTSNRV